MSFIKVENLSFKYELSNNENENILDNINLEIKEGSFVAILGHNGCGKSTFAKHLNAILKPSQGSVYINGLNTADEQNNFKIKKTAGLVFQNPDNQLVASTVLEDVAFGAENLGLAREEILKRVEFALNCVDMLKYKDYQISSLSGGQKQRVAIAGILAISPKCIVLDEPTSMLDPKGRKEVLQTIKNLNKEKGITIILITHYMEEVTDCDRLIIMEKGKIVLDNTPLEVFKNVSLINSLNLAVPYAMYFAYYLKKQGFNINLDYLKIEDFAKKLMQIGFKEDIIFNKNIDNIDNIDNTEYKENVLNVKNVSHIYNQNTPFERLALKNINLEIKKGDFLGIIGHTGSGKSTLIQLLNAILTPSFGKIYFNRKNIFKDKKNLKSIRQKIGVVFQYPEYQLFEETVFKDVCFAPKNMGLSNEEVEERAKKALDFVGIDKSYYEKSPFELSGGEKRRVAIAGILAMAPDVIIFDELTAGLDPFFKNKILNNIKDLHKALNITIILISHSMEDVCNMCGSTVVLNKGSIILKGYTENVFQNADILEQIGLDIPEVNKLFLILNKNFKNIPKNIYKTKDALDFLKNNLILK